MPRTQFVCWDLRGPDKLWHLIVLGLSETLGSSILLFVGCSAALPYNGESKPSLLYVAMAFGLTISMVLMGLGHISGGFVNPSVSTAALIMGRLSPLTYLVYVASECFGAVIGMQSVLMAASGNVSAEYCLNKLSPTVSPMQGVLIEAFLTSILILLVCSSWDPRNSAKTDSAPLRLGTAIISLVIAGAKYTGCSMNPARSFAPTILSGKWENHWVYWLGPLSGSIMMSTLYRLLFLGFPIISTLKNKNNLQEEEVENELLEKSKHIVLQPMSKDSKT